MHTAGVICENITMSTSTKQVPTTDQTPSASPNATTANISYDGVISAGVLVIIGVIAAVAITIIVVIVMRKRAGHMENR